MCQISAAEEYLKVKRLRRKVKVKVVRIGIITLSGFPAELISFRLTEPSADFFSAALGGS